MPYRTLAVAVLAAATLLPATPAAPAHAAAAVVAVSPAAHRQHVQHMHHLHVLHLRVLAARRAASTERARVVAAARSYIGTPYVNGGMSRAGVDCSGLVDVSYRVVGKRLPRTTEALARTGRNVTGHARIGDYILYGTSHAAIVAAVSHGAVTLTVVARHSGTLVTTQRPYAAYTVRSVLA